VMALHAKDPSWSTETADRLMRQSVQANDAATWWYS